MVIYEKHWSDEPELVYPPGWPKPEPVYPPGWPKPKQSDPVDLPKPEHLNPVYLPKPGGLYPMYLPTLDPVYLDLLKPQIKWDQWPWTGCETVHDPHSHFLSARNHISIRLRFTEGVTTPYRLKMRVVQLNATFDRNHAHLRTPSTQPFIPGRFSGLEGRLVTPNLGRGQVVDC